MSLARILHRREDVSASKVRTRGRSSTLKKSVAYAARRIVMIKKSKSPFNVFLYDRRCASS